MANQGCPNEGKDTRLLGRWGCWVQSRLSFHTTWPPIQLLFRFPFYVAFVLPLTSDPQRPRFFSIRAGFRYDPGWRYPNDPLLTGGYIFPEFIIKVMDHVVL